MKLALTGARIFDGFCIHEHAAVVIENEKIVGITPNTAIPLDCQVVHLAGGLLAPGLIDLQINGAGGVQFNNAPTTATLATMAESMLPFGVTHILPTIITDDVQVTLAAITAASEAEKCIPGILGIHVEGPFFSLQKKGVHRRDAIRSLEKNDWTWLENLQTLPTLLTLAPEKVALDDIERLAGMGIRLCAGHTDAGYDDVINAHNKGLSGFTHLYNAMSPITAREPGAVGAALDLKNTWAGLIADGIHVHDAAMRLAIESKGYQRIFLVSDAMATAGSSTKSFELYGETITERNGRLVNGEGKLTGSAITLLDAVRYCINKLHLPVEQALAMATRVPAQFMKVEHRIGTFTAGAQADICWFDSDFAVQQVWQAGRSTFQL